MGSNASFQKTDTVPQPARVFSKRGATVCRLGLNEKKSWCLRFGLPRSIQYYLRKTAGPAVVKSRSYEFKTRCWPCERMVDIGCLNLILRNSLLDSQAICDLLFVVL